MRNITRVCLFIYIFFCDMTEKDVPFFLYECIINNKVKVAPGPAFVAEWSR